MVAVPQGSHPCCCSWNPIPMTSPCPLWSLRSAGLTVSALGVQSCFVYLVIFTLLFILLLLLSYQTCFYFKPRVSSFSLPSPQGRRGKRAAVWLFSHTVTMIRPTPFPHQIHIPVFCIPSSELPPSSRRHLLFLPPAPTDTLQQRHSRVHLKATPGLAPSCRICHGAAVWVSNPALLCCGLPFLTLGFAAPPGAVSSAAAVECKETPDQGERGGHQGMLWSPANRRTGRSHHPHEEAATGVDHLVNCKGAWNSRAQEATCEASCCAEPVAAGAEQAGVALVSPGYGYG